MSEKTKSAPKISAKAKGAAPKAAPRASLKASSKASPKAIKSASKAAPVKGAKSNSQAGGVSVKGGAPKKPGKTALPKVLQISTKAAVKPVKVSKAPKSKTEAKTEAKMPTSKAPPKGDLSDLRSVPDFGTPAKEGKAKAASEKTAKGSVPATGDSSLTEEDLRFASEVEADVEAESGAGAEAAVDEAGAGDKAEKKAKKRDDLKIDRTGNFESQWKTLFDRSKAIKPVAYKMSENYEARTALMHKVLGWGYVLTSQNNRLEVLFKDGIKFLIANYKS